jgi:glutamate/tyrosine decarboxylase-like PLP-dependent enzyme
VAGVCDANLVRLPVQGQRFSMDARALDMAIQEDRGAGLAAVVACIGGTSIGACDDVAAVAEVAPAAEILQIHHRLTSSRVPGPNRAADLPVAASL